MKSQDGQGQRGGRIPSPIPSFDGPGLSDALTTCRAMAPSLNVLADVTRVKPYDRPHSRPARECGHAIPSATEDRLAPLAERDFVAQET